MDWQCIFQEVMHILNIINAPYNHKRECYILKHDKLIITTKSTSRKKKGAKLVIWFYNQEIKYAVVKIGAKNGQNDKNDSINIAIVQLKERTNLTCLIEYPIIVGIKFGKKWTWECSTCKCSSDQEEFLHKKFPYAGNIRFIVSMQLQEAHQTWAYRKFWNGKRRLKWGRHIFSSHRVMVCSGTKEPTACS